MNPFPRSDYDVAELTWENGQLNMHGLGGLGGLLTETQTKPTWDSANDTLESIVQRASCQCHSHNQQMPNLLQHDQIPVNNISSVVASTRGLLPVNQAGSIRIRTPTGSGQRHEGNLGSGFQGECFDRRACASASTTFIRDNDITMRTRDSFESPRSLKTKTTYEGSACYGGSEKRDEEQQVKGKTSYRSQSTRRSRCASIHNQSERRRRDKINQKIKALQKLVPNASKTDKASMLDEVINYLRQLQAQVQMMSVVRNMPQMMVPLGLQQHLQMALLARMGMGMGSVGLGMSMGMGMLNMSPMARPSAPQSFPSVIHPATTASSDPLLNQYNAFLAQSMNMDLYNKMAAAHQQQMSQRTDVKSKLSKSNHAQGN